MKSPASRPFPRRLLGALCLSAALLAPAGADELAVSGPRSVRKGKPAPRLSSIVPIVFIPADQSVTDEQMRTIRQALGNVRWWYQREMPTRDLRWWPKIEVVRCPHTAEFHRTDTVTQFVETSREIEAALGWSPITSTTDAALVMGRGFLGVAGTVENSLMAVIGLESLFDLNACAGQGWCTQEMWHGTALHELGHVLGAGENPADTLSIMHFHDQYKTRRLALEEKMLAETSHLAREKLPKPRARWTFDQCAGGIVTDESGNGNDALLMGPATCQPAMIDNGFASNGAEEDFDYALADPQNPIDGREGLSISAWIKTSDVQTQKTIVSAWSWELRIQEGSYVFRLFLMGPDSSWPGGMYEITAPAVADRWSHVGAVFSPAAKTMTLYVDGKAYRPKSVEGLPPDPDPIHIGMWPVFTDFQGIIDQVEVHEAAIEPAQMFGYPAVR